ncbi:MAG: EAL domain-containing protein, partial [Geodermatophilaceae bacterium]|nr:EAL domain-containing protein [Geodermatophilaceae bacterium]
RQSGVDMPVAVNISARMLHNPDLVRHIIAALHRHELPPASLALELTESALMINPSSGLDVLTRLRTEGVHISVDNFGSGHSSLAYLRDLPANELKIDRSFVHDVTKDGKHASIVRAIIDLAHTLSFRVVAEGIEDIDTCQLLTSWQCDEGQGYYLGRPGAAADLVGRATH